jgi:hypothetical protein
LIQGVEIGPQCRLAEGQHVPSTAYEEERFGQLTKKVDIIPKNHTHELRGQKQTPPLSQLLELSLHTAKSSTSPLQLIDLRLQFMTTSLFLFRRDE